MTAKEYLNQAREIDALIHSKLRELDYWRDLSRRISGSHFEEQHNPNRPSDAPFARCICKIDELERDISHMVDEYVDLQKSVSQAIDCVENNQEKLLLRYRYIDGRTWQKIAELLDVSLRTVHRIHGSALQHFPIPLDAPVTSATFPANMKPPFPQPPFQYRKGLLCCILSLLY